MTEKREVEGEDGRGNSEKGEEKSEKNGNGKLRMWGINLSG